MKTVRPPVREHDRTAVADRGLRTHLIYVHNFHPRYLANKEPEKLELMHDDDHDDLRRGCG